MSMVSTTNAEVIPILQTAVGPVILISGIGLFLLSLTNRFGRVIDRSRQLLAIADLGEHEIRQLEVLWLRARLLRGAILAASVGLLCAAVLVILLFLAVLFKIELGWIMASVFSCAIVSLVGSLMLFYREVDASLGALKLELKRRRPELVK